MPIIKYLKDIFIIMLCGIIITIKGTKLKRWNEKYMHLWKKKRWNIVDERANRVSMRVPSGNPIPTRNICGVSTKAAATAVHLVSDASKARSKRGGPQSQPINRLSLVRSHPLSPLLLRLLWD